jgi:hypothetical protein
MATGKKALIERSVLILARYAIKRDHGIYQRGSLVFLVENEQGTRYEVTLRRSGVHSCSCEARKRCYHVNRCVEAHNKRVAARKQLAEMEAILEEAEQLAS